MMYVNTLAEEAALHSALISGFDPRESSDEQFKAHCHLLRDLLGCTTGALTHPLIINMTLCGHRDYARYRQGKRAAEAAYLPDVRYVRRLLCCWWWKIQVEIRVVHTFPEDRQWEWIWHQHDFLICLEPFKSANGRTARAVYYMLMTALKLPPRIISAEKAHTYYEHKRTHREKIFAPRMRALGYIS